METVIKLDARMDPRCTACISGKKSLAKFMYLLFVLHCIDISLETIQQRSVATKEATIRWNSFFPLSKTVLRRNPKKYTKYAPSAQHNLKRVLEIVIKIHGFEGQTAIPQKPPLSLYLYGKPTTNS